MQTVLLQQLYSNFTFSHYIDFCVTLKKTLCGLHYVHCYAQALHLFHALKLHCELTKPELTERFVSVLSVNLISREDS